MKRIIYLLLGVLMFWSCAETYEYRDALKEAKNAPMEIQFDNVFSVKTKAVIENDEDLQNEKLGVYAKINGESNVNLAPAQKGFLIYNDSLSFTTKWACTKRYFWPKKLDDASQYQTVNFYAYGPTNVGTVHEVDADSVIQIDIDTKGINEFAKDLVFDVQKNHTYDKYGGDKARNGYVDFEMKHQMAWVSFEAKITTKFDSISIDSIIVHANKSTATFYINAKSTNVDKSGLTIDAFSGKLDTLANNNHNYVFDPDTIKLDTLKYKRVADFIAVPQIVKDEMTATIFYTVVIDSIPYEKSQTIVALNGGNLTEGHGTPTDSCATAPWTVSEWKAGFKYTYHINFNWQEILFDASVTTWGVADNGGYYRIY